MSIDKRVYMQQQSDFLKSLNDLSQYHYDHCAMYRNLIDASGGLRIASRLEELPVLSVSLFKELSLKSMRDEDVFKVLSSSGTTGQTPSKIFLDRETASLQSKALVSILKAYLGSARRPMIIVDHNAHVANRKGFSARGAGVQGLSLFGRDHFYALDQNMQLDIAGLKAYVEKYDGQPMLVFGFTFMVWQDLVSTLKHNDIKLDLAGSTLIHSGGWKKLQAQAVDNATFKQTISDELNIKDVRNFYGMVEQTGSIYVEGENGYLQESEFGKILLRKPVNKPLYEWPLCQPGEVGVIQVLSTLPRSYPGHSIMTEDLGVWCDSNTEGTPRSFHVIGRLPKAELRGCSDTI